MFSFEHLPWILKKCYFSSGWISLVQLSLQHIVRLPPLTSLSQKGGDWVGLHEIQKVRYLYYKMMSPPQPTDRVKSQIETGEIISIILWRVYIIPKVMLLLLFPQCFNGSILHHSSGVQSIRKAKGTFLF